MIHRIVHAWQTPRMQLTPIDEMWMSVPGILFILLLALIFAFIDRPRGRRGGDR